MRVYAKERAYERIAALAGAGLDLVSLWRESADVIRSVVPYHLAPCWFTLDPASLLVTSHFNEYMPVLPPELLARECYPDDVNRLADIARSRRGASTLHEATGGDPSTSARWRANRELGADQELIVALRTASGAAWGGLGLYREPGAPMFGDDEVEFASAISAPLADGARRALLLGEALDPEGPEAPGLVVLTADWELESATPGVEQWLADLPEGNWDAGALPSAVLTVAAQALRSTDGSEAPGEIAVARVLSRSGRWLILHGAVLQGGGQRRAAVIVEPAHPARIGPLLMSAYGLSDREQDVTRLVLQGESTAAIADRLVLSPHTVQQHLKSIFEKTGVRSRRDLVGKVFFSYYEPRIRENEERVPQHKPVRGGPKVAH
ncbi:helix-turn-helix transcriptional regulator [Solirubrobacter sp. CPCC 204708]|uniref:Helix-turn-helix transcriptional regulator n=1 Tax=Solirubrobacter deserti TaxID=2282478 RepID=A0ABT4RK26_9ACTN|nr:helix-turn-helix transcriptional regulator [Solirubrobacter deserti]MBE2315775.1 helix-turn-helix transcriptional regulator [Solirubrobacter deserti]MDA0138888.1 helix-turn-helix transcriptional regulator [Solirubrobacter deserti]